jgi:RNA polymerase sigma factor (sigma-70 family)
MSALSQHHATQVSNQSFENSSAIDAFETLYERRYADVLAYVYVLTRDYSDAEDITADTFERAYRHWTSKGWPTGHELGWLLVTARRIATDRWRRLRRAALRARVSHGTNDQPSSEREIEFRIWLHELGRILPKRQFEVLVLRYYRDLSDAQIAKVMGITPSGVRSLLARAVESLKAHPEVWP